MSTYRTRGLHALLAVSFAVIGCLLFWVVGAGIFAGLLGGGLTNLATYANATFVIFAVLLSTGIRLGANDHEGGPVTIRNATGYAGIQAASVTFAILLLIVATKNYSLSRLVLAIFSPLLFVTLLVCHWKLPPFLAWLLFRGPQTQRAILLGTTSAAAGLSNWLLRKRALGIEIVGLLTDEIAPEPPRSFPILGSPQDLEEQIRLTECTHVMLIGLPSTADAIKVAAETCDRLGVRFSVIADWARIGSRQMTLQNDRGVHVLSFNAEPLQCPWNRASKRALDLAIALPVTLFVLPPACIGVWLLHRSTSPGPLFFKQVRTGLQGGRFVIRKFRSMHVGHGEEARQASLADSRVFPGGRVLRKYSIDELPQFINVLLGDMSIVGPRPHIPAHDARFEAHLRRYRIRHLVKPGITGLAQIRGYRGETPAPSDVIRRVRADLRYVQQWSFSLDLRIVCETILHVIRPPKTSF